jgi:hypothetical protein
MLCHDSQQDMVMTCVARTKANIDTSDENGKMACPRTNRHDDMRTWFRFICVDDKITEDDKHMHIM